MTRDEVDDSRRDDVLADVMIRAARAPRWKLRVVSLLLRLLRVPRDTPPKV